jgi:hypothetical protein
MFDNLIRTPTPTQARAVKAEGGIEQHLTEGAVMIAFAMHLLRTEPALKHVDIHPDGEHGKRFVFRDWLTDQGFDLIEPQGKTSYGGMYRSKDGRSVRIYPKPGLGDVVGGNIVAECKGGVVNTKHAGQSSRLRRGLCETIGQSLATAIVEGKRQFVVVPKTPGTESLAKKMSARARKAGIEIALVDARGNVFNVP